MSIKIDYLLYEIVFMSHKMSSLEKRTLQKCSVISDLVQKQSIDLMFYPDYTTLWFLSGVMETRHLKIISPFVSCQPFEILLPSNGLLRGHM